MHDKGVEYGGRVEKKIHQMRWSIMFALAKEKGVSQKSSEKGYGLVLPRRLMMEGNDTEDRIVLYSIHRDFRIVVP